MVAGAARERSAPTGLLSIGQVLARLNPEFPDLTSSKLRFLESKGIVEPSRTPSGYRKFSAEDVERLRLALTLQRDQYLPLDVIRTHLDEVDAGRATASGTALSAPPSITPTPRRYRREDLLAAAGAAPQLLNDAISTGIIAPADHYNESTVTLLRGLVALDRHGIEPRHLRVLKQSAEREVALVESAVSSLLRRTDALSRERAAELAPALTSQIDEVRGVFVKEALSRILS